MSVNNSQFMSDLQDEKQVINFNGSPMPRAYYNLVLSIRDCKLYSKGIKPHRFWKITDVKNYFGVKGSAASIAEQLEQIRNQITAEQ
jgi:hypothetical protein